MSGAPPAGARGDGWSWRGRLLPCLQQHLHLLLLLVKLLLKLLEQLLLELLQLLLHQAMDV